MVGNFGGRIRYLRFRARVATPLPQAKRATSAFALGRKRKLTRRDGPRPKVRNAAGLCRPARVFKPGECGQTIGWMEYIGERVASADAPCSLDGATAPGVEARQARFGHASGDAGKAWKTMGNLKREGSACDAG